MSNVVLLDPDLAQYLEVGRRADRLGGRRRQGGGQQSVAIDADLLRQRLAVSRDSGRWKESKRRP